MRLSMPPNCRHYFILGIIAALLLPASGFAHQPLTTLDDPSCLPCHKKLTEQKVKHAALEGGCSSCHQGKSEGGKTTFTLTAKGNDLCFTCHPDKQELLKKEKMVFHAPFKDMDCITCHNPHGSATARLLTSPVPELCLTCHDNKKVDPKAVTKHAPFEAGECLTCHTAHASETAGLIPKPKEEPKKDEKKEDAKKNEEPKVPVNELCFTCHEKKDFRRHPVPRHPTSGKPDLSRPGKDLTCVSCHEPHQSMHIKLFYTADSKMMMCIECHSKGKKPIK